MKMSKLLKVRRFNDGPTYGPQSAVQATEIMYSIYSQIQAKWEEVKYPDYEYPKVVTPEQRETNINPGATSYVYMIQDYRGAAAWLSQITGNNIPRVGVSFGGGIVPLQASAVAAGISNEDARQYTMGFKSNLAMDLQKVMQKVMMNLIETSINFGDESVNFRGFLSYPGITLLPAAAATDGGTDTEWEHKTAQQMVADVNAAILYVYVSTRTVFCPGVVFLPPFQLGLLATTQMGLGPSGATIGALTALEYLKKNNVFTAFRNKELTIYSNRYLAGAGVARTDRMVCMEQSVENQMMPFPMPYRLGAPVPVALGVDFAAEQKHGPFCVKQPLSMIYTDGI